MIKKIILVLITVICCILVIIISMNARGWIKRNEVKKEMENRLIIISEETDILSMIEFTPFLWDAAYAYGSYYSQQEFEKWVAVKNVKFLNTPEYTHRIIFTHEDILEFDTRIVHRWYLGDVYEEIITSADSFEISIGDSYSDYTVLIYFDIGNN